MNTTSISVSGYKIFILSVLMFLITPCAMSKDLVPFTSNFVAYHKGSDVGRATLALKPIEPEQFVLTYASSVSKFFLSDRRYETSVFTVKEDSLVPITYQYKREGTGRNKQLMLKFNSQDNLITVNDSSEMEWNNELDNQLFRVDLPYRLAKGEREFSYDFINYRGEKRRYVFATLETESLSLPYGQLDAIKVKIDRNSSKRVTYAWFSPDLDYSLVRLQQFKDGKEQGEIKLIEYTRH